MLVMRRMLFVVVMGIILMAIAYELSLPMVVGDNLHPMIVIIIIVVTAVPGVAVEESLDVLNIASLLLAYHHRLHGRI